MTDGSGRKALTEHTVTMAPRPAATMAGSTARVVRTAARNVNVSVVSHSSSVMAAKPSRRGVTAPTLLTRMSSGPGLHRRVHEGGRAGGRRQVHRDRLNGPRPYE